MFPTAAELTTGKPSIKRKMIFVATALPPTYLILLGTAWCTRQNSPWSIFPPILWMLFVLLRAWYARLSLLGFRNRNETKRAMFMWLYGAGPTKIGKAIASLREAV